MLTVESPADLVDTLALYDPLESTRRRRLRAVLWQVTHAESVGFRNKAGRLVAVLFFVPVSDTEAETVTELVLKVSPGLVPHLVQFIRLARLTVARVAQSSGHRVCAFIRKGHEPGQRLARLTGLVPAGVDGLLERWEWANG